MHLSATYIMSEARDRKSRWTISQKCEWEVKRFKLAGRAEKHLAKRRIKDAGRKSG